MATLRYQKCKLMEKSIHPIIALCSPPMPVTGLGRVFV
jgi:hypothetical protein